jgi:hypothetical protein
MPDYRDTSNVTSTVYYNELATLLLNTGGLSRFSAVMHGSYPATKDEKVGPVM